MPSGTFDRVVSKWLWSESMNIDVSPIIDSKSAERLRYNRFVLLVAGLGGLLYGVDVGIIGGALPYLEATAGLNPGQLSIIVAAVLLGSVISTLFAGVLTDWVGRKPIMVLSGIAFVASIPIIALSHGYAPLFFGRLLQGVSGGLIGVVVPLYLAECLGASNRGKGTGIFQWLLTLGILAAALIGIYYSYRVEEVARSAGASAIFAFKDQAWRRIFWVSLPPGLLFVAGSLLVGESPRWLFSRGKRDAAHVELLRSRPVEQADLEFQEMNLIEAAGKAPVSTGGSSQESLLKRKYLVPFALACVILFCNTATGVNSIIGYNTDILLQSGLSDLSAHWGYVLFTAVNFLMTIGGMMLVDRKGRKFLLTFCTAGMGLSLVAVGILFLQTEKRDVDCHRLVQALVRPDQTLTLQFNEAEANRLITATPNAAGAMDVQRTSMVVMYSYGGFSGSSNFARSGDRGAAPIHIERQECVPANRFEAFLKNPLADLGAARTAPLKIDRAILAPVPDVAHGWSVALALYAFMGFFALGPGVCVWLALSELMPSRIRSNGMSIALVINQMVSTTFAALFLPVVSQHGYSTIFFIFASFTLLYFVTAVFFLPETKGKTLEEIETYFQTGKSARAVP